MSVRLRTRDGVERELGVEESGAAGAVPCFRCGVCCERWSPELAPADVERLAHFLSLTTDDLLDRFARPYPPGTSHVLRHTAAGCVFLARDPDGRAACSVHPARPQACRDWQAGLERRECREGLTRMGNGMLAVADLYPGDPDALAELLNVIGLK